MKTALLQVKQGGTSDPAQLHQRRVELVTQLTQFYKKYDMSKLENKEALDKVVDYGLNKGMRKLNAALREKYNDDLDTIRRETIRQSVRDFISHNQGVLLPKEDEEEEIKFALENGMGMLDQKLKNEYGASLTSERTW